MKTSTDLTGTTIVNSRAEKKTSSGSFFAPLPILALVSGGTPGIASEWRWMVPFKACRSLVTATS